MAYWIDHYARQWRKAGHQVCDHIGLGKLPDADLVIVHIDLTVVPPEYVDLIRQLPATLNGEVLDISRRHFNQRLLSSADPYAGPVIVKTDANYGNVPEASLKRRRNRKRRASGWLTRQVLAPLKHPLLRKMNPFPRKRPATSRPPTQHWNTVESLDPFAYPVFPDLQSVPAAIWTNPHLIVEPFIRNYEEGLHYVCYYEFFGDKYISGRIGSPHPIVKFSNSVAAETIPLPAEVKQWREELKMDFGRLDYLKSDGKYVLIDINKTEGGSTTNDKYHKELKHLASGLDIFLT